MKKQTVEFATVAKNGIVKQVGKTAILQPKTNFKDKGGVKWYDDKLKKKNK